MLAFTKKTGYGLIAMSHLATLADGQLASAREMAERFHVPAALLMNVLKELSAAGMVSSVRGAHGGYRLSARPEEIDLAQLVTVLEGPIRLAECLSGQAGSKQTCMIMDHCPIVDPVHQVQRRLSDFLKTVTLADIAEPSTTQAGK